MIGFEKQELQDLKEKIIEFEKQELQDLEKKKIYRIWKKKNLQDLQNIIGV